MQTLLCPPTLIIGLGRRILGLSTDVHRCESDQPSAAIVSARREILCADPDLPQRGRHGNRIGPGWQRANIDGVCRNGDGLGFRRDREACRAIRCGKEIGLEDLELAVELRGVEVSVMHYCKLACYTRGVHHIQFADNGG